MKRNKFELLRSNQILTKDSVSELLGIKPRSAANLLQRWANECAVVRTGPGEYMSTLGAGDREMLILQSLAKRLGRNIILVGSSSWERVGWCEPGEKLHVAVPLRPSRPLPRMLNTVIYPVGAKRWVQLAAHSVQMDLHRPPILHPLDQMLWWMDETPCPVEMPSPDRVNWKAIRAEPDVAEAMLRKWPEHLTGPASELNVELLYRMMHMDRLTGAVPGPAEPIAPEDDLEHARNAT